MTPINQTFALDSILQFMLPIGFIALFIYLIPKIRFFKSSGVPIKWIQIGFGIKLIAALSIWIVYSQHYSIRSEADTFRYYDDSRILFESIHENPVDYLKMVSGIRSNEQHLSRYYDKMNFWYDTYAPLNDNRTIIRLQAIFRLFSMGSYHVHMVLFCLLSLVGAIAFAKAFGSYHPNSETTVFSLFVLIPSTCFWGSGLMKDSLAVFALGMAVYRLSDFDTKAFQNWGKIIWLLIALVLLLVVRFQFFLLLAPFVFSWLLMMLMRKNKPSTYLMTSFGTSLLLLVIWNLSSEITLQQSLQLKREAFINLAQEQQANSIFSQQPMEIGFPEIVLEAGKGLANSFTKPMDFSGDPLVIVASIENLTVLILLLWLLIRTTRSNERQVSLLVILSLTSSLTYMIIAGMTTPVAGALVRYKSTILPMLIGPMLIMAGLRISSEGWKSLLKKP